MGLINDQSTNGPLGLKTHGKVGYEYEVKSDLILSAVRSSC